MREARADRVVLLTTHYMDEADALADRIGIMARGRLRALGSAQHLKSRHGGGYRVDVKAADGAAEPVGDVVARLFPGARLLEASERSSDDVAPRTDWSRLSHGVTDVAPRTDWSSLNHSSECNRPTFAWLLKAHAGTQSFEIGGGESGGESGGALRVSVAFRALERAKQERLISNYSLSQTTLEQVRAGRRRAHCAGERASERAQIRHALSPLSFTSVRNTMARVTHSKRLARILLDLACRVGCERVTLFVWSRHPSLVGWHVTVRSLSRHPLDARGVIS